jgi:predicted dehydrogenase
MNVGVIGFGYWGTNLVRNLQNTKNCNVTHIAESEVSRHKQIHELYPDIEIESFDAIIKNSNIDAVVIATSISSHYELAKAALENDKHVLVEKPMTNSEKNAQELIKLSKLKNKILMADHTYLYSGAVQEIKKLLDANLLGEILYVDSIRANLGKFQSDVNVLWDLAPHDISIINYLINEKPVSVQATGKSYTKNQLENIAYLILHYESNKIVHVNCSWISPIKIRTMIIGASKKMLVFDDLQQKKIRIYNKNLDDVISSIDKEYVPPSTNEDFFEPEFSSKEALLEMTEDFVNSIINNKIPLSNGDLGLDVIKILDAAERSIRNNGKEVFL